MSACQCSDALHTPLNTPLHTPLHTLEPLNQRKGTQVRATLFSWVTVLMVAGWVGIVTVAFELAGPRNMTAVPTLEAFLKTLL